MPELTTDRLLLRQWRDADREPFAALNADPVVMEHFPALATREESDALIDRTDASIAEHGWGLWAVEMQETGQFIGFTGLSMPTFEAPFLPAVEIGWRLAKDAWGNGYATEAARAALDYGVRAGRAGRDRLVHRDDQPAVAARDAEDRHDLRRGLRPPAPAGGHRLQRHVLYRITRPMRHRRDTRCRQPGRRRSPWSQPTGRTGRALHGAAPAPPPIETFGPATTPSCPRSVQQLTEYFAGERTTFDVPLESGRNAFPATGLAGAARHPVRRNHDVRRTGRALGMVAGRFARRRPGQREEPGQHHRPLPPRDRLDRQPHRLRRRPGPQAMAARPRTGRRTFLNKVLIG